MGKRSDFPRVSRDCYDTPPEAVAPLIDSVSPPKGHRKTWYYEPCVGSGALFEALRESGKFLIAGASDIHPRGEFECAKKIDALDLTEADIGQAHCIITNPPWDRKLLHPMIEHFSNMRPTWLLFDADWMHTKQSVPFMPRLCKIVSVGRVKWIPGSKMTGKDNCAWYLFDANNRGATEFVGRRGKVTENDT